MLKPGLSPGISSSPFTPYQTASKTTGVKTGATLPQAPLPSASPFMLPSALGLQAPPTDQFSKTSALQPAASLAIQLQQPTANFGNRLQETVNQTVNQVEQQAIQAGGSLQQWAQEKAQTAPSLTKPFYRFLGGGQ